MEITAQLPRKYHKRKKTVYEQILEEGMEKGIEKGMEKGLEKGMEKGMEKGAKKTLESMVLKYSQNYPEKTVKEIAVLFDIPVELVADILEGKSL